MDKDKLGPLGTIIGTFSFMVFGVVGYMNPGMPLNVTNIAFGVVVGLLFGFISKFMFSLLLAILNRDIKEKHGNGSVKSTVKRSTIFMFPFAVMVFLATYFLDWSAVGVFYSAAIMNTGVMASLEISKLKGKSAIKNTIVTSITASLLSYLWLFSSDYLKNGPALLDGAISLIMSLTGVSK